MATCEKPPSGGILIAKCFVLCRSWGWGWGCGSRPTKGDANNSDYTCTEREKPWNTRLSVGKKHCLLWGDCLEGYSGRERRQGETFKIFSRNGTRLKVFNMWIIICKGTFFIKSPIFLYFKRVFFYCFSYFSYLSIFSGVFLYFQGFSIIISYIFLYFKRVSFIISSTCHIILYLKGFFFIITPIYVMFLLFKGFSWIIYTISLIFPY